MGTARYRLKYCLKGPLSQKQTNKQIKVNLLRIPGPNVKFTDVVEATRTEVASLKAAGAKIIIALTHIGYKADKLVAETVDGIDVIVGGHSHSFLYTGKMPCFSVVGAHLSLRTPN